MKKKPYTFLLILYLSIFPICEKAIGSDIVDRENISYLKATFPFLNDQLIVELHPFIDVLISWYSHAGQEMSPTQKPRLATLSGFPIDEESGAAYDAFYKQWTQEFESGHKGELIAIPNQTGAVSTSNFEEFYAAWTEMAQSQRIFISYTAANNAIVNKLKTILEANGYLVFNFLTREGGFQASAQDAGRLFSEAGVHLVIDSPEARSSPGIAFEAILYRQLMETATALKPDPLKWNNPLLRNGYAYYSQLNNQLMDSLQRKQDQAEVLRQEAFKVLKDKGLIYGSMRMANWGVLQLPAYLSSVEKLKYLNGIIYNFEVILQNQDSALGNCSDICTRCKLPYCFPFCMQPR